MLPDRVSNPGPLAYESGALPIALRGPALYLPFQGGSSVLVRQCYMFLCLLCVYMVSSGIVTYITAVHYACFFSSVL